MLESQGHVPLHPSQAFSPTQHSMTRQGSASPSALHIHFVCVCVKGGKHRWTCSNGTCCDSVSSVQTGFFSPIAWLYSDKV